MDRPSLTVLTDPIPTGIDFVPEKSKRLLRHIKYLAKKRSFSSDPLYRGHFAVTRSLLQGLEKIGVNFNYSPRKLSSLAETVIVLAGVNTLRQAIRLKQGGHIKKLFAGPNIFNFSDRGINLASPEVDAAITASPYIGDLFVEGSPSLRGRIITWAAGVDVDYWRPERHAPGKKILIYKKQNAGPVESVEPFANYLREKGYEIVNLEYGNYTHGEFLEALQQSQLMIGFVIAETQGIAWAEAWSVGVPTLIWRNTSRVVKGRLYKCSTAPYLCDRNGLFFDNFDNFRQQFAYWESHRDQFDPRTWALKNMSDEVCAQKLYSKVTSC
ncbi:MAG: hypothetical protein HQ498_04820 [Pseudohongiella sp.]|nr:hypothetical protein [Pseudohongiella sp.]